MSVDSNWNMSVDSSPDLDKILYSSMSVDSSPDLDKILYWSKSVDSSFLSKNHWRLVQADKHKSSSQRGWVSIDRGVIAALLSTTPRPVHKSSTDNLGPPLCQVGDQES